MNSMEEIQRQCAEVVQRMGTSATQYSRADILLLALKEHPDNAPALPKASVEDWGRMISERNALRFVEPLICYRCPKHAVMSYVVELDVPRWLDLCAHCAYWIRHGPNRMTEEHGMSGLGS